ncbi:H-type small acid-soluble spore protein [Salibacterium halotolerans]|uniref:Small, acid-soluble spore protein H n=1 Tax=Salibacterium halotolerans TaxID=1884432 RepID=A0A1I5XHU8_9BACI|nr:H-type small acid-soluble spore protein [Salibacterium halotolerans]SFQ31531.1 small acid-soluble spore protein H (minor) [Salibacterium halotolerans]
MDVLRARDIADSPVMADVTYDGTPVYIQHVAEDGRTARIYSLEYPDEELTVPLEQLLEH